MYRTGVGKSSRVVLHGSSCSAVGPAGKFCCTLSDGHPGVHIAGTEKYSYAAEWDDDRSTDIPGDRIVRVDDFFAELGL